MCVSDVCEWLRSLEFHNIILEAENAQLRQRLAEAVAQRDLAMALEAENATHWKALEVKNTDLCTRQAELEGRLALYEGGAGPSGQQWGEAELEAAADRLKAAAGRVEELRMQRRIEALAAALAEARAAPLAEERASALAATFECPICFKRKDRGERRALHPCGHVLCATCTPRVTDRECPKCRGSITGFSPVFD
eukprot:tig00000903_g5537.t1